MRIRVSLGLALLVAVAAPAGSAPGGGAQSTYVDPTYGYSITYPANWEFKPPNDDARIFVSSPMEGPQDNFRENLNFAPKQFDDPTFSLKGKCADFLADFAKQYEGYAPGKCTDVMWNGVPAIRADYSFDKTGNGITRRIHALQTFAIKNGYFYVVTFTAIEATYPRYLPIANRMIASIRLPKT